jgi:hypothetical protein
VIATGLQLLGMVCVVLGLALIGWWLGGVVLAAGAGAAVGGVLLLVVGFALEGDD